MKENISIEQRIIEKCRQGDVKAQYQLYQSYSKAMYNIAIRFVANKMDAEDILQDSFITAFGKIDELKDSKAFGGWLKRIVTNNCISLLRKKKLIFSELEGVELEEESDEKLEIEPGILHEAIKELPSGARSILILRGLEGYSHKEISEIMEVSLSTSKTQYSRALALLGKKLKQMVYEQED